MGDLFGMVGGKKFQRKKIQVKITTGNGKIKQNSEMIRKKRKHEAESHLFSLIFP
jgi:hypothetical protein